LVVRYSPPGNVRGKYTKNVAVNTTWSEFKFVPITTTKSKACGKNSYIFVELIRFLALTHWIP